MKSVILLILIQLTCFSQEMYFPFDTNDKFQYEVFSSGRGIGQMWITIGADTLMPNGKVYKPFVATDGTNTNFFRKVASQVFQYSSRDSMEFLRYDFSKLSGDTVSIILLSNGRGLSLFTLVSDETKPVLGVHRRVQTFKSADCCDEDMIADSIGVFDFRYVTDLEYYLLGAIISGKTYGNITSVKDLDLGIPTKPDLSQNYPNPFNPSTKLHYTIPKSAYVKLTITNEVGQEIAVLVNSHKPPGTYDIEWDASNYSSGIYLCSLSYGTFVKTVKLILLK
jgi:hypothetical protein